MPFDWMQYHALADELRTRKEEAYLRSAISRVYYCVYCQVRNHLRQSGTQIPEHDSAHRFVWNFFKDKGKTSNAIAYNGGRLHYNRKLADYEDEIDDINKMVDESFGFASRVLYFLNQIQKAKDN